MNSYAKLQQELEDTLLAFKLKYQEEIVRCAGDNELYDLRTFDVKFGEPIYKVSSEGTVSVKTRKYNSIENGVCYLLLNGRDAEIVNPNDIKRQGEIPIKHDYTFADDEQPEWTERVIDLTRTKLNLLREEAERRAAQAMYPLKEADATPTLQGIKDSDGKLSYELSFEFLQAMALRMEKNKAKYPPYNWKKPIDREELNKAIKRHFFEIQMGMYADEGEPLGHIVALACNLMMLWEQMQPSNES
jgi:hypothetical protein